MSQGQPPKKHAVIPRASAPPHSPYPWDDEDYDDRWPPPVPNSAIRYQRYPVTTAGQPPVIVSGNRRYTLRGAPPVTHQPPPPQTQQDDQPRRRVHWMLFVGLALFAMLAGWVLLTMLASWWQVKQDDWNYGRPRTFQTDMVVGHSDSAAHPSHFIAINYNRHIEIIEFAGGDPSKARVYIGPTLIGIGEELAVVTLSFKDVNGDGKLDMIVNVQDSHFVFINDQGQFRPPKPGDNISM